MSSALEELKLDLEELKKLQEIATRRKVKVIIENQVAVLQNKYQALYEEFAKQQRTAASTTTASPSPVAPAAVSAPTTIFHTVNSFSFADDKKEVQVYVALPEGELAKEVLSFNCTEKSFELKFKSSTDKCYRFSIPELYGPIDAEKSKATVAKSQKKVIVTLIKKKGDERTWFELTYNKKANYNDEDFKTDPNEDPSAGIMKLMKKMYDEGDEEIKKSIAKAWSENQNKRGGGGLF